MIMSLTICLTCMYLCGRVYARNAGGTGSTRPLITIIRHGGLSITKLTTSTKVRNGDR